MRKLFKYIILAASLLMPISALASVIGTQQGGTGIGGATPFSVGDIIYASGATTLSKLTIGNSGDCLKVNGGVPVWLASCSGGGGGSAFPFNILTNYGTSTAATTTPLWAQMGLYASSTSHFVSFDATSATTTNATSTNLYVSGTATIGSATGLDLRTSGVVGTYAGTSCTNQFPRSLNASGAATCASVANTDLVSSSITINSSGGLTGGGTVALGGTLNLVANGTSSLDYYSSLFRDWSVQGNGYLAPTTTRAILVNNATSTIANLVMVNSTSTNATTTSLAVTAVKSALDLGDSNGVLTSYGGTSCTNQFPRSLSATGAATCATVANTDLANSTISGVSLGGTLAALTAGTGITSAGTYTGNTARTFSVDQTFTPTWSGLHTFTGGILGNNSTSTITNLLTVNATTTNATSTNSFVFQNGFLSQASSTINALATLGNLLVNASTTLQNFTGKNATTTNATTTQFAITSTAVAAGTFLAADPNGVVIATSTPSGANASQTVKGIVQEATPAQINSGTQTGSTGAELFMNPSMFSLSSFASTTASTTQYSPSAQISTTTRLQTGQTAVVFASFQSQDGNTTFKLFSKAGATATSTLHQGMQCESLAGGNPDIICGITLIGSVTATQNDSYQFYVGTAATNISTGGGNGSANITILKLAASSAN